MKLLSIQDFSKITDISKSNLRYYEKLGLLLPISGENNYRYHKEDPLRDIKYLAAMK